MYIPPYPPILARRDDSPDAVSRDAPSTERKAAIAAGVLIGVLFFIFVLRFAYHAGYPWYKSHRAAKVARQRAIAEQKLWYKSSQLPRRATSPVIPHVDTFAVPAHEANAVEFLDAARRYESRS
ncbi:hypothetical protein CC86DRAFT_413922 [Ophiobolus disseminans]|uniref:Transmembrane protein n=1 Tax=Ophiobolus disseminans TaxID=1469910 RepID=A0A6A6ZCJ9_9PLEO|nr:hypothetical protein CC86DRAFT_413922 [Ophiobolus disseminans]